MADERLVRPDDDNLLYDQYYNLTRTRESASFRRCYDPKYGCDLPESFGFGREWYYHPGARVTLLTDATRVHAVLVYVVPCEEACAGTLPNHCYHPRNCERGAQFQCGACTNHCAPNIYVDGVLQILPTRRSEFGEGSHDILLFDITTAARRERRLELVMPWGGQVELHQIRLCCGTPSLRRPTASSTFHFVAYGDSITQGFCAGTPYPEAIGRLNGWNALNLGIGGMQTSPQHGIVLGRVRADLVLVAIGTNDWWGGCDVTAGISGTIEGLRREKPRLPLVMVTMLARGDEPSRNGRRCIVLEDFRQQIRDEVKRRQRAGDQHLYLIEGKPLLSLPRFGDGLHPGTSTAMEELAANINAQMGFSAIQYTLSCEASTLRVQVRGISPLATCELHWGTVLENVVLQPPCAARSLMVGGAGGKQSIAADASGAASYIVRLSKTCTDTLVQAVDLATCTVSRVIRASDASSIAGSAAENYFVSPRPKSPSPSQPSLALPPQRPPLPPPRVQPSFPPPQSPQGPSIPPPRLPPRVPLPQIPSAAASLDTLSSLVSFFDSSLSIEDLALVGVGFCVPTLLLWTVSRLCSTARLGRRNARSEARRTYASLPTSTGSNIASRKQTHKKRSRRRMEVCDNAAAEAQ